jgi:hypothetical protein
MSNFVLAALFLPLSHFGLSSSRLREFLVGKLGERRYLTLYKLVTVAAFGWRGWRQQKSMKCGPLSARSRPHGGYGMR